MEKGFFIPRQGCEFVFFASTPRFFAPHFHDYWLVGRLSGGCHEVRLRGETHYLDENCLLLLNAGEAHSCRAVRPGGRWEALHIFPELMSRGNFEKKRHFGKAIATSPGIMRDFADLAEKMRQGKTVGELYGTLEKFIGNLADFQGRDGIRMSLPHWRFRALSLFSRLDAAPSLDDLAMAAEMGKYRFSRLFSRHYGISPHRYFVAMRLNRARRLLAGGMAPAEAAQMTGFYDQAHFTRSFKASMGYTPGEYRRFLSSRPH